MNSNDQTPNNGKTISNLKTDAVNGENIIGGGKETIIMPTFEEEAAGINNSGFPNPFDGNMDTATATTEDNGVVLVDDGTVK